MFDKNSEFHLVVPTHSLARAFTPGTAFVALEKDQYLEISYEPPGEYSNITTFEHQVHHAAGRLSEKYPTSKKLWGDVEEWKKVGTIVYRHNMGWIIETISDENTLIEWDAGPHYAGGSPEAHQEARNKEYVSNISIRGGL